ncbi:MAG: type II toxin-antitoxin system RelE/ParE family toxin [Clostridia bacterium]|nr:type II toxin-antitoxin system RelE/ParE family toxin [Clostridia bacterium]
MACYTVDWQGSARKDIHEIRSYLEAEAPPEIAKRILGGITTQTNGLGTFPYRGAIFVLRPRFRRLVVEGYSVLYRVDEVKKAVKIYYVYHHARDVQSLPD